MKQFEAFVIMNAFAQPVQKCHAFYHQVSLQVFIPILIQETGPSNPNTYSNHHRILLMCTKGANFSLTR